MSTFYCSRQRAGPLTIQCEALRPERSAGTSNVAEKYRRCAVNRSPTDRVEARLALIGWGATEYVLTFDDASLPEKYRGVQRAFALFRKRMARWRASCGKPPDWDWLAVIEGKHGDRRWHLHFVCDYDELTQPELQHVWRYGTVEDEVPVLKDKSGFFRLARYLTKESRDGWIIPIGAQEFTCSRALSAKVPPAECWRADRRRLYVPRDAICLRRGRGDDDEPFENGHGLYWRTEFLVPDWSPSCRRAMIRMGYFDEVFRHEQDAEARENGARHTSSIARARAHAQYL